MRRHDSGTGCGARGQASQACTREAPGPDRGALRPLRREPAGLGLFQKVSDGPRRDKPMRRTGAAAHEETGTETRKRGPGEQKSPRWRAERRHTFARRCAHVEWPRRLARHPLDILSGVDSPVPLFEGGEENTAYPAPVKNTGGAALANCCLKTELIHTAHARESGDPAFGKTGCLRPRV